MPEILNADLDWKNLAATFALHTVFRGEPRKVLVGRGHMLCRFITTEPKSQATPGTETFKGCWWMDWGTTSRMLAHWKAKSASTRDVIRARLAVTSEFSQKLDGLVQIILTEPVYAWKGIARQQPDASLGVTYMGGGEQIYLPNLASDPLGLSSRVALMHSFTATDLLD
jgi:hypothetical protein